MINEDGSPPVEEEKVVRKVRYVTPIILAMLAVFAAVTTVVFTEEAAANPGV